MTTQTTDHATERQSAKDIIREFFGVAPDALPGASMDDPDIDAWAVLRAYMLDEADAYIGEDVRLHAHHAMFEDGVNITLV